MNKLRYIQEEGIKIDTFSPKDSENNRYKGFES